LHNLADRYGVEAAEEFATFVNDHINAIKQLIETEGLDCDFELRRSFDVVHDAQEAEEAKERFRASVKAGHRWTRERDLVEERYVEQVSLVAE